MTTTPSKQVGRTMTSKNLTSKTDKVKREGASFSPTKNRIGTRKPSN